ncbi:MAG: L-2-amino-thiazoline-4-carboxylic acid hydrolase [Acetanaerobacterium sp.]
MPFTTRQYALLYGYFAKFILTSGHTNSFDILKSATRRYGYERGRRMAQRAREAGDGEDFAAFLAYIDWRPGNDWNFSADMLPQFPVYSMEVTDCGWHSVWSEFGLEQYCATYCDVFETALVQGFNPELDLKLPRAMGKGDSSCVFVYNGMSFTRANLKRLTELQEKLRNSCVRSWEQHTAHMYYVMSQELIRILGQEEASTLVKKALVQFGEACTAEDVKLLLTRTQNVPYSSDTQRLDARG